MKHLPVDKGTSSDRKTWWIDFFGICNLYVFPGHNKHLVSLEFVGGVLAAQKQLNIVVVEGGLTLLWNLGSKIVISGAQNAVIRQNTSSVEFLYMLSDLELIFIHSPKL